MAPVFSLVWDEDVSVKTALTFPELYKDLMKVHSYLLAWPITTITIVHEHITTVNTIMIVLTVIKVVYMG